MTVRRMLFDSHDPYEGISPGSLDLQGWASHSEVFRDVINEIKPKLIIEVGTWKGASAIHMASLCSELKEHCEIVCVDTFLGSFENWLDRETNYVHQLLANGRPQLYETFLGNVVLSGFSEVITPFPIDSVNAAQVFSRLGVIADMIYIDAGHAYENVAQDLRLFKEILRPGGVLVGDDWFHPPIQKAVADVLGVVVTRSPDKFSWHKPT